MSCISGNGKLREIQHCIWELYRKPEPKEEDYQHNYIPLIFVKEALFILSNYDLTQSPSAQFIKAKNSELYTTGTSLYSGWVLPILRSLLHDPAIAEPGFEVLTQAWKIKMIATVDGIVTTQYTHILLVPPQPSPQVKKLVLKYASDFVSRKFFLSGPLELTETKVPGRKVIPSTAINFITELSS